MEKKQPIKWKYVLCKYVKYSFCQFLALLLYSVSSKEALYNAVKAKLKRDATASK